MLRKPGITILIWLTLLFLCAPAFALEVPERPKGRVTDRTGTLTRNEIAALERRLAAFERETTNQIAVLLIASLAGDSLEDYSIRLAEKWKVGQKGKNNGVILLIVKNERKLRIEVGYGLEGALPDALAGSIIRNEIAPRFKAGEFYQGIEDGVTAIMKATKGEYKAPKKKGRGVGLPFWLIFLLIFLSFAIFSALNSLGRRRQYHSGGSRGWMTGGGFFRGRSFGKGSGGSFSGGGGDFGGGGASGQW